MSHGHGAEALSDADLVALAVSPRTGTDRAEAFDAIARRYRQAVFEQCAYWLRDPDAAQDVGQTTFAEAFRLLCEGKPPGEPGRLGGWLIEVARRRKLAYLRTKTATPRGWARTTLPEDQGFDDLRDYEEREEYQSGRALRLERAQRLVGLVVRTLDEADQQICKLRFQKELSGREIGEQLGMPAKTASNRATLLQDLIADRFGVLILALEGGPHCGGLARILQEAQFRGTGENFTAELRERIVRHFSTCPACDNCRTCAANRDNLVAAYAPVLILLLFSADFLDRISELIGQMTGHSPRTHSGAPPGPPAELAAWTQPEPPPRRHETTGHRRARARSGRTRVTAAAAAGAAVVVAGAVTAVALTGTSHPAAGSSATGSSGPAPAQALLGAAVPVRSCGARAGSTGTVRLPAGLTLPPGAAVFDTGVTSPTGAPAARYMIGPAARACTRSPSQNGSTFQAVGAEAGPQRVLTVLTPSAVTPSCTASAGNMIAQGVAILAGALPCPGAAARIDPGLVRAGLGHAAPGMSAVAAWSPAGAYGYLFAPGTGNLPTYGVFTAWRPTGQGTPYDSGEIACTLPASEVSVCSAALRYFLIQAAGPGTPAAALQTTLSALQRFIRQRSSAG